MSSDFEEFIKRETEYLTWVAMHPDGFVLNANSNPRATYMPLHTASCRSVTKYKKNARKDSFTSQGYIKICAVDPGALLVWMGRYGAKSFSRLCSKCNPDTSRIFDQVAVQDELLYVEARKWMAEPEKLRQHFENIAPEPPNFYYVQTKVFKRSPKVVAAVLLRGNGVCEKCRTVAPFYRAVDNEPYLEVHHKVRLADGGVDHPDNALALCPNCHREAHFG